jgi:hypothetical protein
MSKIKVVLIAFHFFLCSLIHAQQSFYELGKKQLPLLDSLMSFDTEKATEQAFNYFSDSIIQIELHFNYLLSKLNKNRSDTLMKSTALTATSQFCSTKAPSLFSSRFKTRESKTKRIKQILHNSKKTYGLVSVHTFAIPLLKKKRRFFYDKNGPDGEFNLYKGNKPTKTELEEGYEYIQLEQYTYEEMSNLLSKKIRASSISKEFQRKRTCAFGYHFFINPRTVGRKKMPELRCIVILGHKRMPKQRK